MTVPHPDLDPDDHDAHGDNGGAEFGDGDPHEVLVWQLLLLINPGDEESALQQFAAYRDALSEADADDIDPLRLLTAAIDWKSGFHIEPTDTAAFVDAIDELVARWNLRIDWGTDDPSDDGFLTGTDVPALMALAHDRLREDGYTLWTWNSGSGTHAGWIALSRDDEAMQALAPALGIEMRAGSDAF